jgi:hypothetical protein
MPYAPRLSTPLAMLALKGCAWLRAPTGLKGFDKLSAAGNLHPCR